MTRQIEIFWVLFFFFFYCSLRKVLILAHHQEKKIYKESFKRVDLLQKKSDEKWTDDVAYTFVECIYIYIYIYIYRINLNRESKIFY